MPIEWRADFETGEKHVDDQHKQLFDYVNELHSIIELVRAGQTLNRREVQDLLFHLESYVSLHFAYEEICMVIHKCPMAVVNKEAHDKLIKFYGEFLQKVRADGVTLDMLVTLEGALVNWLTNHICKIDLNIKGRLRQEKDDLHNPHRHNRRTRHSHTA